MPGWSQRLQRAWTARGPLAAALLPLALVYGVLSAVRRISYRLGWLRVERLSVPVIVVGNLVAGGAGKTPTVLALVELLRRHRYTPGIVSRGYGGAVAGVLEVEPDTPATLCGDEPLLLRRRSAAPVHVGRDRVAAARALLHRHREVDIVVSDDGLQHFRLARDVEVLVFDERGAGNGWLLPAGALRAALPRVAPARSLVLYNAPQPTTPLPGHLARGRLSGAVALRDWWRGEPVRPDLLEGLRGRAVIAAAGMARPERFFAALRAIGVDVVPLALPDHFDYATLPWPESTTDVIVTEKDAVKLDPARIGAARVWVAALDFVPAPGFEAELLRLLAGLSATASAHGNSTA
ncbi:MAG: tetraacyldisaccharide 4'-kinase [Caldimonas sp.]